MDNSAVLSPCREYRYRLSRNVNIFGDKVVAYFGVNPSTADESIDDRTVKKWIGFTERNNGKRFIVGNVFAYRSKDVRKLAMVLDPVGPDNERHIAALIEEADILIPCWGSRAKLPKALRLHLDEFMEVLLDSGKPVLAFGRTSSNDPLHPLMLSYNTKLIEWR